ncbi:hypothetical protein JCM10207_002889 [Rhodosporidiobolus poonsookiae]
MDAEALRLLADTRATVDTKALKKTVKDFHALLSAQKQGEELQAAHAAFLISLDQLAQHLAKAERIEQVAGWEVDEYRSQAAHLEESSSETRQKLLTLEDRLVQAQQERARRIEYDGLAKTIGKLPDRTKGQETITRLTDDISNLRAESAQYADTWRLRKEAFGDIVDRLEKMQGDIRDEKAEQERRRALDADADADGEDDSAAASAPMTAANSQSLDPTAAPFVPGTGAGAAEGDVEMRDDGEGAAEGREEGQESTEEEGQMQDVEREEGEM